MKKSLNIAVVGGGIFGVTSAIYLARKGHRVDLFERHQDILQEASGLNQYRLHRGYHYPRSSETTLSTLRAEPQFCAEYAEAVIDDVEHYYCLAKENSFVSGKEYLDFCRSHGLEFSVADFPLVNKEKIDVCVRTKEKLYNSEKLRKICLNRLHDLGVTLHTGKEVSRKDLKKYNFVVIAVYANQGALLGDTQTVRYQYEVCEKPVIKMPDAFKKKSIMIIDGPFMCLDPLADTGLFVTGNVVHAIHSTNVGSRPDISPEIAPLLNRGIIKNPPITKFEEFRKSGAEFIPALAQAEHIGSMFVIRTVLPYMEETDARPTLINYIDERTINIFSGKIVNCVEAAERVVHMIERMDLYASFFNRKRFVKSLLSSIIVAATFFFLWREMGRISFSQIYFVIHWNTVALAFILYGFFTYVRALRLRFFLGKRLSFRQAFLIIAANSFWNNILPFRAGELSYLYLVKKTGVVGDGENLTSLVITRFFDIFVVTLAVAVSAVFIFVGGAKSSGVLDALPFAILVVGAIFFLFTSLIFQNNFWLFTTRKIAGFRRLPNFLARLFSKGEEIIAAFSRLRSPSSFLAFGGFSVLVWFSDFLFIWIGFHVVGLNLAFFPAMFIVAFPVIASMIPLQTPAGIGTFEGAVTAGLIALGIGASFALGASILLHAQLLVFSTALFLATSLYEKLAKK